MSLPDEKPRKPRRFLLPLVISTGVLPLVLIPVGVVVVGLGNQSTPLRDLVLASPELHPRDETAALCHNGEVGCTEGWQTDVGSFLRFSSDGGAEEWATTLGDDGRRWGNTVLDMHKHELTFDQRRLAIDTLFASRDWS